MMNTSRIDTPDKIPLNLPLQKGEKIAPPQMLRPVILASSMTTTLYRDCFGPLHADTRNDGGKIPLNLPLLRGETGEGVAMTRVNYPTPDASAISHGFSMTRRKGE